MNAKKMILVNIGSGVAVAIMIYIYLGDSVFDNYAKFIGLALLGVIVWGLWMGFSFLIYSFVKNVCWHRYGYKKTNVICFPFVFFRTTGWHLLSSTLTYSTLVMDCFPDDFVEEQSQNYKEDKSKICIKCEKYGMFSLIILQLILIPLLYLNKILIIFLLMNGLMFFCFLILDDKDYKGVYTKWRDYKNGNMIYYLARVAAYQNRLHGDFQKQFIQSCINCKEKCRFELYILKTIKAQLVHDSIAGESELLFDYFYNYEKYKDIDEICRVTGRERVLCLKHFSYIALLHEQTTEKRILLDEFERIGQLLAGESKYNFFAIFVELLSAGKTTCQIDNKFDQEKQLLTDNDIYSKKIYVEYAQAWNELKRRMFAFVGNESQR